MAPSRRRGPVAVPARDGRHPEAGSRPVSSDEDGSPLDHSPTPRARLSLPGQRSPRGVPPGAGRDPAGAGYGLSRDIPEPSGNRPGNCDTFGMLLLGLISATGGHYLSTCHFLCLDRSDLRPKSLVRYGLSDRSPIRSVLHRAKWTRVTGQFHSSVSGDADQFLRHCQPRIRRGLSGDVGARKVRAYCPVSFALKLALFCLILGLVAGVWLSSHALSISDSSPSRPPSTQETDGSSGPSGEEDR